MHSLVAIVVRLLSRKVGTGCRLKKPSRNDEFSFLLINLYNKNH
jgi:hypothetical protein